MFTINPPLLKKLTGAPANAKEGRTFKARAISINTRTIQKGDLFIALYGEKLDGHNFALQAFEKAQMGVIVDRVVAGIPLEKQIIVPDTQKAFETLAAYRRSAFTGKAIGLTGSAGKTTTREGIQHILSQFGPTYGTTGNNNNHFGTPHTLCHIPSTVQYGVFEMGMSAQGEISHLTRQVRPHIALITNIYPMHIEFFKNLEGIAHAKAEIFEGLEPNGTAIINTDTHHADILLKTARTHTQNIITFGKKADIALNTIKEEGGKTHVTAYVFGKEHLFTLSTLGQHHVYNALAILSVAYALGLDTQKAAGYLKDLSPLPGRGKIYNIPLKKGGSFTLVDESYSGQPASTKLALERLATITPQKQGRRIAILGQMAELGTHSKTEHESLGQKLAALPIDYVIGVGAPMVDTLKKCAHPHEFRATKEGLLEDLENILQPNDVVLIKGSRYGSRLFEVVQALNG